MNVDELYKHSYCINLDRRPDRWERMKMQFYFRDLKVVRFSAVDGRELSDRSLRDFLSSADLDTLGSSERTRRGQAGCYRSHVNLLGFALASGISHLAVFEDDLELASDFWARMFVFIDGVPDDWELIITSGRHALTPIKINKQCVRVRSVFTTGSYIVRNIGTLSDVFLTNPAAADHSWQPFFIRGTTYAPAVFPIKPIADYSDIANRQVNPTGTYKDAF